MNKYLFLIVTLLMSGCNHYLKYETELVSVQQEGPRIKHTLTSKDEVGLFSNRDLSIVATLGTSGITIILKNKSNEKMKILWDETLIVDHKGRTHRTVHHGVRYGAHYELQPPTIILPYQFHADTILSADTIHYNPGSYSPGYIYGNGMGGYTYNPGYSTPGYWQGGEILRDSVSSTDQLTEIKKETLTKDVHLHLTLEHRNKKQEYQLTFKIKDVKIED
ncbi:hypothetical protein IM40_01195 [Candidatus Paracaedimonas acanthamoebae]|nr:hypothetical protein IM40_01195 [Candidatus Paracaedimonas acanthamoebae]